MQMASAGFYRLLLDRYGFLASRLYIIKQWKTSIFSVKEIKVGEPFMFKYQTETLGFTSFQLKSIVSGKVAVC